MSKRSKKPGSILKEDPHNYGIDLLRCLAMFLIVLLHLFTQGGAMEAIIATTPQSFNRYLCYGVRFVALGAVNIYGMISGYVMLNSSFKPRRFISLWLQVVVIALAVCGVFQIFFPERISKDIWLQSALPISQRLYWYFTCYAGVFLLSPAINRGIRALTDAQAVGLLAGCVILFCVVAGIGYSYQGDAFYLVGGYSVLWLLVLYVIGACLRKSELLTKTKAWKLLLTMAVCIAATYAWQFTKLPDMLKPTKVMTTKFLNPFLAVFDICLFVLIARAEFCGRRFKKILKFTARLTFTVYLLHLHPSVWAYLENRMRFVVQLPVWSQLPVLLAVAFAVFLAGVLIDWLRLQLFRLLRVDRLCAAVETLLRKTFSKFARFLLKRF